ncbi:hypothetical protein NU195Hw_g8947t1 [Hortaea werneckii]
MEVLARAKYTTAAPSNFTCEALKREPLSNNLSNPNTPTQTHYYTSSIPQSLPRHYIKYQATSPYTPPKTTSRKEDRRSCLPQPPPHPQPPQPHPLPRWEKVRSRNPASNSPAGAATTVNAVLSLAQSCKGDQEQLLKK